VLPRHLLVTTEACCCYHYGGSSGHRGWFRPSALLGVNEALCLLSYAAMVEPLGVAPRFRVYQTRVLLLNDGSVWLSRQGTILQPPG
jgi:hypothetical protein